MPKFGCAGMHETFGISEMHETFGKQTGPIQTNLRNFKDSKPLVPTDELVIEFRMLPLVNLLGCGPLKIFFDGTNVDLNLH